MQFKTTIGCALALGVAGVIFPWTLGACCAEETRPSFGLISIEAPSSIQGEEITSATLSGNGFLALGTAAGRVAIVDKNFRRWRSGMEVSVGTSEITELTFSNDGLALAGLINNYPFVWRLGDQKPTYIPVTVDHPVMALGPGGHLLALANFDVSILDLERKTIGKLKQEMREDGIGAYEALAFTTDAAILVAASGENTDAWMLASGKRMQNWSCGCDLDGVAFSRDGSLAAVGTKDAHVLLWDTISAKFLKDKTFSTIAGDHVYGTAVDPKGMLVAAGTASGFVAVWDTRSGAIVGRTQLSSRPISRLESSDDGRLLLVVGQKEPYVRGRYDYWLVTLTGRQ